MNNLLTIIRPALRQFVTAPAWSISVSAVFGLGLGLAMAAFILVDGLLFRPLGVVAQDRLVKIAASRDYLSRSSFQAYREYRDRSGAFDGVIAWNSRQTLHWRQGDGSRERVRAAVVSGNYFGTLGVVPSLGRAIGLDDDRDGAPFVAVASDYFWRTRLGARVEAIGATLALDDHAVTLVGVLPSAFTGLDVGQGPELFMPLSTADAGPSAFRDWGWRWLSVVGRLKPGVDFVQADAQVDAIARARDPKVISGDREARAQAVPLVPLAASAGDGSVARTSWLLLGGALLIMLTACANATGLLLVRGERRRGEYALHLSLGASTTRLALQSFAECVLLAFAGAALGLVLAGALVEGALAFGAAETVLLAYERMLPSAARVVAATFGLAIVLAMVASLVPALRSRRLDMVEALKTGGGGGGRRWRLGRALVVGQFSLTVVLVVAAGLLLRSLHGLWAAPLGVAELDARVMMLDYSKVDSLESARAEANTRRLLESLANAPGVASAAIGAMVPISGSSIEVSDAQLPDRTDGSVEGVHVYYNPVSRGFFAALGVALVAGRDFGPRDVKGAPGVAIVSQTLARERFPGVDPIGRHIDTSDDGGKELEIIGVAPDIKLHEVNEPWRETVYVPFEQRTFTGPLEAVVRARAGEQIAAQAAVARAWHEIEPNRAIPRSSSIADRVSEAIAAQRFMASTLGTFATLALLLAATGIYSAFAFWVSVRRRELGLRLAIGASARQVFALVLGDGLRLISVGAVIGVLIALALARWIASALVDVSAYDLPTYVVVPLLVAATGLCAAALPARRAAQTDPQQSLRCE